MNTNGNETFEPTELDTFLNGDNAGQEAKIELGIEPKEEPKDVEPKEDETANVETPTTKEKDVDKEVEEDEGTKTKKEDTDEQAKGSDELNLEGDVSEGQSKDKNHPVNQAFSRLRHEKKEFEKVATELKSAQELLDNEFKALALKNGYKDITNAAEYLRAVRQQEGVKSFNQTNDPNDLIDVIKQNVLDEVKPFLTNANSAIKETSQAKVEVELQQQVDGLNEKYGTNLKKYDDIVNLPNADKVIDYLEKDLSLDDAYYLANKDTIVETKVNSAKQKAINVAKGYDHVKQDGKSNAVKKVQLTQSEIDNNLSTWRQWFPKESDSKLKEMILSAKKNGEL